MERRLLHLEAIVPTVVVAVVSWEIPPAPTVRVHHLQQPAVMEVQILQIYQMENVVMKVRNILPLIRKSDVG